MDITQMTGLQIVQPNMALRQDISIALGKKVMEQAQIQADGIKAMMPPVDGMGAHIDIRV